MQYGRAGFSRTIRPELLPGVIRNILMPTEWFSSTFDFCGEVGVSPVVCLQKEKTRTVGGQEEAAAPQPEGESAPPPAPGGGLYEVALMEGEVSPFVSYRHALEQVEALAAKLKANPGLEAVPVTLPIETDPKAELKGSVDEEGKAASATFSLRLTRRIESP